MRKNEYSTIEEFTSQYTGEWAPSEGHWFGLDFSYHGCEYRFNTGSMYNRQNTTLNDGSEALFGLYRKDIISGEYILLEEFATMDDVLKSTCIDGIVFKDIIMADETELLGQD